MCGREMSRSGPAGGLSNAPGSLHTSVVRLPPGIDAIGYSARPRTGCPRGLSRIDNRQAGRGGPVERRQQRRRVVKADDLLDQFVRAQFAALDEGEHPRTVRRRHAVAAEEVELPADDAPHRNPRRPAVHRGQQADQVGVGRVEGDILGERAPVGEAALLLIGADLRVP